MPSPQPQPTISGTPIPYPAYGTPAPDVAQPKPKRACRSRSRSATPFEIAVALSPAFALENAQWAAIHARYTSSIQALYPGLSANASDRQTVQQMARSRRATRRGTNPSPPFRRRRRSLRRRHARGVIARSTLPSESVGHHVTQLIYDGGRTIANIRSAKDADIAGRATLLRQLQTLALNVANLVLHRAGRQRDGHRRRATGPRVRSQRSVGRRADPERRRGALRYRRRAVPNRAGQGNLVTAQGTAIGAQATFATTLGLDADAQVVPKQISPQPIGTQPDLRDVARTRAFIMRPD